jgi:hypothetical protein
MHFRLSLDLVRSQVKSLGWQKMDEHRWGHQPQVRMGMRWPVMPPSPRV